jgi:hypothetical protein
MMQDLSLTLKSLVTLLRETLLRADSTYAYLLNSGDPGFVETLKTITATQASAIPAEGRKPIVSHANHTLYGIELANRALGGEQGVYESADWNAAWQLTLVDDRQWRELIERSEQQSNLLIDQISQPRQWDEITLTGSFSIPAHTAYHLGAIRQILLDVTRT